MERRRGRPQKQYAQRYSQIVVAMLAQKEKRQRRDMGESIESDDSDDEDVDFDNSRAVAIVQDMDAD